MAKHKATSFNDHDNLVIKGNNLIALHSIAKQYAGKVKLIYLDPPYNTGSDSFAYNDKFNHSTWLTFMKSRLEITVYLANINKPMSYLILLLCLFFCLIFWISDTFYLREERCFRSLYEIVRKKDEENIDFSMNPIKSKETFLRCMFRPIFLMSYLPIFIIIIHAIIIKFIH